MITLVEFWSISDFTLDSLRRIYKHVHAPGAHPLLQARSAQHQWARLLVVPATHRGDRVSGMTRGHRERLLELHRGATFGALDAVLFFGTTRHYLR